MNIEDILQLAHDHPERYFSLPTDVVIQSIDRCKQPRTNWDGIIALLVILSKRAKDQEITMDNIYEWMGKPTATVGSNENALDYFVGPSDCNVIGIEHGNGLYQSFCTMPYSEYKRDLSGSDSNDAAPA